MLSFNRVGVDAGAKEEGYTNDISVARNRRVAASLNPPQTFLPPPLPPPPPWSNYNYTNTGGHYSLWLD